MPLYTFQTIHNDNIFGVYWFVFVFCYNVAWNLRYQNKKKIDGIKSGHYMDIVFYEHILETENDG